MKRHIDRVEQRFAHQKVINAPAHVSGAGSGPLRPPRCISPSAVGYFARKASTSPHAKYIRKSARSSSVKPEAPLFAFALAKSISFFGRDIEVPGHNDGFTLAMQHCHQLTELLCKRALQGHAVESRTRVREIARQERESRVFGHDEPTVGIGLGQVHPSGMGHFETFACKRGDSRVALLGLSGKPTALVLGLESLLQSRIELVPLDADFPVD